MITDAASFQNTLERSYPAGVRWDSDVPVYPLFDMLEKTAVQYGDRPAFDFMGHKMKWQDIHDQALWFARGLQDMGVGKGTRVGLFLPNCPYYLIAYFAIARTGATIVNFNPLYPDSELRHLVEDSGTTIMITSDLELLYSKIDRLLKQNGGAIDQVIVCKFADVLPFPKNILFPILKKKEVAFVPSDNAVLWYHDLISQEEAPRYVPIDPIADVALLQYTGGTTGVPKGAMLTHANIVANAEQCVMWLNGGRPGQDKMLGVLPFFHVFAMTAVMNFSVRMAFEIIALPRFELDATLQLIHKKKPNFFPAVPAIYNAINNARSRDKYDLSSLQYCISGGAPLPVEVKRTFEKNTGCVVVEGYGLTESSPVVCCNPVVGENKPGSIGMPLPGTFVEIVDPDDKTTLKAQGEKGELCVRGPQVMRGYWNKPKETSDVLRDGRLYTGDVAIIDEDGYVFIVDRLKDMIITNGYNVYPRNVEEAIYKHPSVEECIVAGLPDQGRGEIVKAWVKCRPGKTLDPETLKAFLKDLLSPMEMPRQIEFRDQALPKTMIGKLSRKDVVAQEMAKHS